MDASLIASDFDGESALGLQSSIRPLDAAWYLPRALMESENQRPITLASSRL